MSAVIAPTPVNPLPNAASADPADLRTLLRATPSLRPETPVMQVADSMLDAVYEGLLSLPIVGAGKAIGLISRYELMRIYLMRYGRELYGHRAIETLTNRNALSMSVDTPIEEAARRIAESIASPITDDFIITDAAGVYLGTGVVLDVLQAMDARLTQRGRELEQAYARVKSSQLQLVQSEKMASLGQMVAGLVHEINTPLGYVRNNVEMTRGTFADAARLLDAYDAVAGWIFEGAQESPADLPVRQAEIAELRNRVDAAALGDLAELLDDSVHGLEQIGELIGNLKDFSRLDQGRTEKADVNQLVASALRIVQHILRKREIEVVHQPGELPQIDCSPAQINQVLLNLLNNAAQSIEHDHGRITLRTQFMGGKVLVLVEDNGKGIEASHLERIFDPFFTTKKIGEGTGLGLAIAHQIVTQHQGMIRVVSKPGVGTRFLLILPVAVQRAAA